MESHKISNIPIEQITTTAIMCMDYHFVTKDQFRITLTTADRKHSHRQVKRVVIPPMFLSPRADPNADPNHLLARYYWTTASYDKLIISQTSTRGAIPEDTLIHFFNLIPANHLKVLEMRNASVQIVQIDGNGRLFAKVLGMQGKLEKIHVSNCTFVHIDHNFRSHLRKFEGHLSFENPFTCRENCLFVLYSMSGICHPDSSMPQSALRLLNPLRVPGDLASSAPLYGVGFLGLDVTSHIAAILNGGGLPVLRIDALYTNRDVESAAMLLGAGLKEFHVDYVKAWPCVTMGQVSLTPLARALKKNTCLKTLDLRGAYLYPEDIEAFFTLLSKHNTTLQELNAPTRSLSKKQKHQLEKQKHQWESIQLFLRLNKYGRKRNASPAFFVDALIAAKDDTPAVFFYLSKNPYILKT